jgi:hypothetical protein
MGELTARSVKALLDNLHDSELDLPFIACPCWHDEQLAAPGMAEVTTDAVILHNPTAQGWRFPPEWRLSRRE